MIKSTDQCEAELERMILHDEINPGDRLSEGSLALALNASKANVAKAFERLVARRILVRSAKSGTYLRVASMDEYFDALEVRTQFEMLSVQRLTRHYLPEELAVLREAAARVDAVQDAMAAGNTEVYPDLRKADLAFHDQLVLLAGNQVQIVMLKNLRLMHYNLKGVDLLDRKRMAFHSRPPRHADIINAIASGNPDYASDVIRIHIQNGANILISCMTNQLPRFEDPPLCPAASVPAPISSNR